MFTGIIEAVGKVVELQQRGGDVRLRVSTGKLDLGDVVNYALVGLILLALYAVLRRAAPSSSVIAV